MENYFDCKCSPTSTAERNGRNLVICIDCISNEFDTTNTNVAELYNQISKEKHNKPLTYYDSGIGTYATPSCKSWSNLKQVMDNKIDLMIARNQKKVIIAAYRWLSDQYGEGDKIFLFGFARGAFQVRALAGMIETVGLMRSGSEEQIPFAYDLYAAGDTGMEIASTFKRIFSRTGVRVHFVGVWDTVSSVGLVHGKKMLPRVVECCDHVCYFRHALALDEHRVKFLPEYVHEGKSHESDEPSFPGQGKCTADIKEVWFAGTHSDVNTDLNLGDIPLLWMRNEAIMAGLHLKAADINWKFTDQECDRTPSLGFFWKILELIPIKRLSYKEHHSTTRRFEFCFFFMLHQLGA
ncbi:hypothetical protein FIBSPDRAFT_743247 [Athelia psychrophila]|uniref:T6SS Phospholipase effector Tle1-like catalytic domain-containing protein n=1 Tax=Athelia psychrophila TaxID=1759441 RepID=A0A166IIM2_9AGAM|nr:hypothetical protein FIBSPDRAFT_743247 [Fibularhizoctonia sp. CBS 109695]